MPRAAKRALIDFAKRRREMVEHQVAARGVRSELVLEAMRKVPREEFLILLGMSAGAPAKACGLPAYEN